MIKIKFSYISHHISNILRCNMDIYTIYRHVHCYFTTMNLYLFIFLI